MRHAEEMVRVEMGGRESQSGYGGDEEEEKKGKGGRVRRSFHREPAAILLRDEWACSMTVPLSFK